MRKGPHLILYNRTNTERITALDFGTLRPNVTSREIEVWVWNKKDFDDAPTATDVRVGVLAANGIAGDIVAGRYIEVRSQGIQNPDGRILDDDIETSFTGIGGELTESGAYHSIGDIPTNCARRLVFRVNPPESFSHAGIPRFHLRIGCFSEDVKWLYVKD